VGLGGQEQPDPTPDVAKERVSPPMNGSCERVATSTFVTNSYQRMPSIRLWFVILKASSFAISAFNSVQVSEAYSSNHRTHELWIQLHVNLSSYIMGVNLPLKGGGQTVQLSRGLRKKTVKNIT